jgi:hypothetical protein
MLREFVICIADCVDPLLSDAQPNEFTAHNLGAYLAKLPILLHWTKLASVAAYPDSSRGVCQQVGSDFAKLVFRPLQECPGSFSLGIIGVASQRLSTCSGRRPFNA